MIYETELKLSVPPDRLPGFKRSPVLRTLKGGRGVTRRLLTIYYDTPSLALARQGMALRVRHLGQKRVQTVKLGGGEGTVVQQRPEIEVEIPGDVPDLELIPDVEVREKVATAAAGEPLAPAFIADVGRTTWPVRLFDSEIEMALDVGEIRGGERKLPVSEIELELKSGRPERLIELALVLHKTVPVRVEHASKAARGFALVADRPPQPARAKPVELKAGATVADAFAAIARNCLAQLGANEAAVLAGEDPEGVHQMRVAVRRFRALASCFKERMSEAAQAFMVSELEWFMDELGPARDWDVFITETLEPLSLRSGEADSLADLLAAARVRREEAYRRAAAAILNPRYTGFLLKLDLWLSNGDWADPKFGLAEPARDFAATVLRKRHRKLHKLGRDHRKLDDDELHRVRIGAKKLRYAGEFFRALFSKKAAREFLGAVATLQDRLGALNDGVVGRGMLAELLGRLASAGGPAGDSSDRVTGLVLGWHAGRIDMSLAGFQADWERFLALDTFWTRR
jgi:inorganic triphosphatase YgiF